jgi:hypothetical protein
VKIRNNTATSSDAGQLLAELTGYFASYNLSWSEARKKYFHKASEIQGGVDGTGKPITSAKAEILSKATAESDEEITSEAHVKNLDVMIQTLKKIQDGLIREFGLQN